MVAAYPSPHLPPPPWVPANSNLNGTLKEVSLTRKDSLAALQSITGLMGGSGIDDPDGNCNSNGNVGTGVLDGDIPAAWARKHVINKWSAR